MSDDMSAPRCPGCYCPVFVHDTGGLTGPGCRYHLTCRKTFQECNTHGWVESQAGGCPACLEADAHPSIHEEG